MPQVLINREQLPHLNFDVELLGDCDVIVNELCHRLGGDFEQLCYNSVRLCEITEKPPRLTELSPSEALPASSDAAHEEQTQHRTDSEATPSDEAEGPNVTETAGSIVVPKEPCPNAQHASEGTNESSDVPAEEAPKDESSEVKSQTSNFEFRRRCWMSRINRSPISKRLESKLNSGGSGSFLDCMTELLVSCALVRQTFGTNTKCCLSIVLSQQPSTCFKCQINTSSMEPRSTRTLKTTLQAPVTVTVMSPNAALMEWRKTVSQRKLRRLQPMKRNVQETQSSTV